MKARRGYIVLFLVLVAAALITRIALGWLYLPDVLTAAFVYLFFRIFFLQTPGRYILLMALALTGLVELSQLIHTPGLDELRAGIPGRFLLGTSFDVPDLFCYGIGALGARLVDKLFWGA